MAIKRKKKDPFAQAAERSKNKMQSVESPTVITSAPTRIGGNFEEALSSSVLVRDSGVDRLPEKVPSRKDVHNPLYRELYEGWSETSVAVEVETVNQLGELITREQQQTGVRPSVIAYTLAAFMFHMPTKEQVEQEKKARTQHVASSGVPYKAQETKVTPVVWREDVEFKCRKAAKRIYASGAGKGSVLIPPSWYWTQALKSFIAARAAELGIELEP